MKDDTGENVEFAIKLQDGILVPVDSHFPIEKFKAIDDAHQEDDKKGQTDARTKLQELSKIKQRVLWKSIFFLQNFTVNLQLYMLLLKVCF